MRCRLLSAIEGGNLKPQKWPGKEHAAGKQTKSIRRMVLFDRAAVRLTG